MKFKYMISGFFLFILVLKIDKILKLIFSNKKNDLVSLKEKINEDIQFIYLNKTKQIKSK
jgi:hypothetical protein